LAKELDANFTHSQKKVIIMNGNQQVFSLVVRFHSEYVSKSKKEEFISSRAQGTTLMHNVPFP